LGKKGIVEKVFLAVAAIGSIGFVWIIIDHSRPEASAERHLRSFERAASEAGYPMRVGSIKIKFIPLPANEEGRCWYRKDKYGERRALEIELNADNWSSYSNSQQELIMFHELGHCVLHREHNPYLRREDERPESIMYPTLMSQSDYEEHRATYLSELFKDAY
jgi:hypothetical protein